MLTDNPTIEGKLEILTYDATPAWYQGLPKRTKFWLNKWYREPVARSEHENLVMNSADKGVRLIVQGLKGDRSSIQVNSARIGTDGSDRSETDNDLQSPYSQYFGISNYTQSGNSMTAEVFMTDNELPNDTYKEFALYLTNNNLFFCAAVLDPAEDKASGQDKQINYEITVNN